MICESVITTLSIPRGTGTEKHTYIFTNLLLMTADVFNIDGFSDIANHRIPRWQSELF